MRQTKLENFDNEIKQEENVPSNNAPDQGIKTFVSAETQNKIIRLFMYLEKALALDDSVVRDFRNSVAPPSPWWLADFPRDVENLYIRPFDTEKITEEGLKETNAWLSVEKKKIKAAPQLPEILDEWISEINPIDKPKAKEKLDRKVCFGDDDRRIREFNEFKKDFEQGDDVPDILAKWVVLSPNRLPEKIEVLYIEDRWIDHPELHNLLEGYIKNDWHPWAERVRKIYKANLLYDQLYALRLLLKNEGDNYELLLGHGLLTWRHKSVGLICAPIFLTPLTLDFNAAKRIIEIMPDPMFRGFAEISSLYEVNNAVEIDLNTWSDRINERPFDFWHFESLKAQSQTLVNYLSAESEDNFKNEMVTMPQVTERPCIWNAPVIFARKRTNDLWSKYAASIRRDIEQNKTEVTEFVTDLVGEYKNEKRIQQGAEDGVKESYIEESELFFPLPWNDEQKRIAERLEFNYGVVVKGPPGTGKSHTIANLISRFLAQGKTVLVTSQSSKALDVLRDKLPRNIQSLAVSQLHQTARRDDILQQSVSEISSNLGGRDTKFSDRELESIRKELKKVREEKASLANQIRQYILMDSSESIKINNEEIGPIDAAKLVSRYKDDSNFKWNTDKIPFDADLNFSEEDLQEIYKILLELETENRNLSKFDLPPSSLLPSEETVSAAFSSYRELSVKIKVSNEVFGKRTLNFEEEELSLIWGKLLNAKNILISIDKDYEQNIFDVCGTSQYEREKWHSILVKISENIQAVRKRENAIIEHEITGKVDLSLADILEAIILVKNKISNKTRLGTIGRLLLSSNARKVIENYKVDGRIPETLDRIEVLQTLIEKQLAEKRIRTLLKQSFASLENGPDLPKDHFGIVEIEVLIKGLYNLVDYTTEYASLDTFFKNTKELSEFSFLDKKDVDRAIDLISSYVSKFEVLSLEKMLSDWIMTINNSIKDKKLPILKDSYFTGPNYYLANGKKHPILDELIEAIQKKNTTGWKNAFNKLRLLESRKYKSVRFNEIAQKIKRYAPNLLQDIIDHVDNVRIYKCPDNLLLVWKIARLESWLNKIHDHVDIDVIQSQLERLTRREHELNSDLVTILAWQRQIDKVTKQQRDALMAWSSAMKKYGKGMGKHAPKWLRSAQLSLKEAKHAVPVWIMPLHRAAQMFSEPKPGMFDVVIFDEASQCDLRGLTIGYLGKKLLVVGDPDQISPAGIFQDLEKSFELISRFLYDIPYKETFSITSSLFDLAKIRIPNMIQLNEHFRCVPEVIAFSNYHIYDGCLKPLRHPHPKGLLKPALVPMYVEKGYQNTNKKVNEPEAEALVSKLVECMNDQNYQKRPDGRLCTFGIISLLAEDQAKYIENLIRNLVAKGIITEKQIEERRIECGDAYKFQGDERDVMFLSMVRALDPNNANDTIAPLVDESVKRRFNVAASRARDQVFLFHSIPLEALGNKNDWRFKLLNWFYDPKKEELRAGREALKREFDSCRASQFSFDVGNILIDRGYQVLPEYPVIGYRIDLVVQGENARLAVECDGDQYHTLENWEEDQVRERQLRRAGWEFWRVTGSSFYRYKERALDSLWKKLDELGIQPIISK